MTAFDMTAFGRRARSVAAAAALAFSAPIVSTPAMAERPLTVAATIETARILHTPDQRWYFQSPDGSRYAFFLLRGDLGRNGLWRELYAGEIGGDGAPRPPRLVHRLFHSGLVPFEGAVLGDLVSVLLNVEWRDARTLTFVWPDADGTKQIIGIDLESGGVQTLTQSAADVMFYRSGPDGTLAFATAPERTEPAPADERGRVIQVRNLYNLLLLGQVEDAGQTPADGTALHLVRRPGQQPVTIRLGGHDRGFINNMVLRFAPDGRWLIADGTPASVPAAWDSYDERITSSYIREIRTGGSIAKAPLGRNLRQFYLIDLDTLDSRPLLDAPAIWSVQTGTILEFSPDGSSVLAGPNFLPVAGSSARGLSGQAIFEIDLATGRTAELPLPASVAASAVAGGRWRDAATVELSLVEGERLIFTRAASDWQLSGREDATTERPLLEVRQDRNRPPRIYDAAGRLVFDPNPGLAERYALGAVSDVRWTDREGRDWTGLLFLPPDHREGQRHPLVIQTHGHARPGLFSLYGDITTGPGQSIFAARALAGRGIAVLQIQDRPRGEPGLGTPQEPRIYLEGYESAIRFLSAQGLVDEARVGLAGFSRTGWHVEYALTHGERLFGAAIVSDNLDGGYVNAAAVGWSRSTSELSGRPPFGPALADQLEQAPAFSAERVRTPLRMHIESHGLVGAIQPWEFYSRLRRLDIPVELFAVPNVAQGAHGLYNPGQLLASQEAAVDWFDFWLNGHEVADPAKAAQYERWRPMRARLRALRAEPRPPLLEWTARPR